jgi:hypothetical protein
LAGHDRTDARWQSFLGRSAGYLQGTSSNPPEAEATPLHANEANYHAHQAMAPVLVALGVGQVHVTGNAYAFAEPVSSIAP